MLLAIGSLELRLSDFQWFLAAAGVGIGFGLQDLISNFFYGLVLLVERPVQVGDSVEIGAVTGTVHDITLRSTTIRTRENKNLVYPNKALLTEKIVNLSMEDPVVRREVAIGVAYGSDIAAVRKILHDVATRDGRILPRPQPDVLVDGFADGAVLLRLRCWPSPEFGDAWPTLRSDLLAGIEAAFRRDGIGLPGPSEAVRSPRSAPGRGPATCPA